MTTKALRAIAKSRAAARRSVSGLTELEISEAISNLRHAASAQKKREIEKERKIRDKNLRQVRSLMKQLGVSAPELQKMLRSEGSAKPAQINKSKKKTNVRAKRGPKKGTKVAPKYQLKAGKQTHTWTGRGRMPLVFQEHVASGKSLESCLIK